MRRRTIRKAIGFVLFCAGGMIGLINLVHMIMGNKMPLWPISALMVITGYILMEMEPNDREAYSSSI